MTKMVEAPCAAAKIAQTYKGMIVFGVMRLM